MGKDYDVDYSAGDEIVALVAFEGHREQAERRVEPEPAEADQLDTDVAKIFFELMRRELAGTECNDRQFTLACFKLCQQSIRNYLVEHRALAALAHALRTLPGKKFVVVEPESN